MCVWSYFPIKHLMLATYEQGDEQHRHHTYRKFQYRNSLKAKEQLLKSDSHEQERRKNDVNEAQPHLKPGRSKTQYNAHCRVYCMGEAFASQAPTLLPLTELFCALNGNSISQVSERSVAITLPPHTRLEAYFSGFTKLKREFKKYASSRV